MSSTPSLVDSAVELEARRRVAEEQAAARKIALQKQKEREMEKMRLIEAQREDRVRREAEQIQARLRAEEAEREARAKAEAEAFEAAVAAHAEALRKRPLEERLRAEIEELREVIGSLTGDLRGVCAAPPPSYGISAIQSQVASLAASPWNTGISELKTQLSTGVSALQAQLGELRTLSTKPARTVFINASAGTLGSWNCGGARTLEVVYHLIPQGAPEVAAGAQLFLDIPNEEVSSIAVPAGQKLFIHRAQWKYNNNTHAVTPQLKAMGVEHQ